MRRLIWAALVGICFAGQALAFDLEAMSDAERAAFQAEVRAYLLENPEVIVEAIEVLEARQAEQQVVDDRALVAENAAAIYGDGVSYVGGNPEGDVTVVEFLDYRCGFCRRAHPEVVELLERDGNIRLIIKEFPILGEQSELSARYAISVLRTAGGEAYKIANDTLMAVTADLTPDTLAELSDLLGLDHDDILAGMDASAVTEIIAANHALGQALGITGTPTFIFGDRMVRGYVPLDGMEGLVEEIRAN